MTRLERENWLINIESCIDHITELNENGYRDVAFVLGKYGASCIENLQPWQYGEVFNDLYAIEADLK